MGDKLTIYSAPTNDNPNRVIASIPASVQLDTDVSTISIVQTQELDPVPTVMESETLEISDTNLIIDSIDDGFSVITNYENNAGLLSGIIPSAEDIVIDANKNVSEMSLLPGAVLSGVLNVNSSLMLPILEINTVQLPVGYVPVENLSPLENYAYNLANSMSNGELEPLLGMQSVPEDVVYNLQLQGDKILIEGSSFVDSVRIDWLNVNRNDGQRDWTTLGNFSFENNAYQSIVEWNKSGIFKIRAIPYHKGYPLPGYKTYDHQYFTESLEFSWSFIQTDSTRYILRLEGNLNEPINYIKILEGTKQLFSGKITTNNQGFISREFDLKGVSESVSPYITIEWYRVLKNSSMGYHFQENIQLSKNYAKESISLSAYNLPGSSEFELSLSDPKNKMHKPSTEIAPFSGTEWDLAIRNRKLMVYLEIRRHQNGDITNYGYYPLNITQKETPTFLEGAPFVFKNNSTRAFSFSWEDTQEFRQLANVDAPRMDLPISYEFRLIFWSCGIEQSIRSNEEYIYPKSSSFRLPDRVATHNFSYNTWTLEHPRSVYHGVHPEKLVNNASSHISYGRSQKAIVISSDTVSKSAKTTDFSIEPLGWQVLYQIDTIQDDVKEFPFYSFNIRIPAGTQDNAKYVCVYLVSSGNDIKLGQYHPTEGINIVDFLGHYKEMKNTADSVKTGDVFKSIYSSTPAERRSESMKDSSFDTLSSAPILKTKIVTDLEILNNKLLEATVNKSLMEKVKEKKINYRIEITFANGTKGNAFLSADTSEIPSIPPEPNNDMSFTAGNAVLSASAMNISSEYTNDLQTAIANAPKQEEIIVSSIDIIKQPTDNFGVHR